MRQELSLLIFKLANFMEIDIPLKREFQKLLKRSRVKKCLHPNKKDCSERIIKAHSIQNNKILSKISEEGKVMMIYHDNSSFNENLEPIGKGKANTFFGFCSKHDTNLFSEIENKDYVLGNLKQEFLFAYRALAKEIIAKETLRNLYNLLIKEHSAPVSEILEETEVSLKDLDYEKSVLDKCLENSNFENIETKVIIWDKEYMFAISSIFDLILDLKNNQVNNLSDLSKHPKPIFLTIFPQMGKTYVLISYLKENSKDFKFLKEQILDVPEDEQKRLISWIICLYCENFAISPKIWREFDPLAKKRFIWLFHYSKEKVITLEEGQGILIPFNLFYDLS